MCEKQHKFLKKGGDNMYIYRMYITKNGHRIYRPNHKPFRFWVDDEDVKYFVKNRVSRLFNSCPPAKCKCILKA